MPCLSGQCTVEGSVSFSCNRVPDKISNLHCSVSQASVGSLIAVLQTHAWADFILSLPDACELKHKLISACQ